MNKDLIIICIPTYKRPNLLRNCLIAIAKLQIPDKYYINIIIIDNDENETARVIHSELQEQINLPIYYFVEKSRGLSTVRNRLLEESILLKADLIAFIDDDEQPAVDWLYKLTLAMEKHNADVCTGPATEINTENLSAHKNTKKTGSTPRHISTNNVLLKKKLIVEQKLRFDIFYNFIGGEDFDFFERSSALGNTHVWVAEAKVYEVLIEQRERLSYLYYRHFTGGINSIMRYRRSNPLWRAWLRYLPKIIGKLLSSILSLLLGVLTFSKKHRNNAIKRFANGTGYFAGLMNVVIERYKNIQAEDINTP